jgi:hypothetical protein
MNFKNNEFKGKREWDRNFPFLKKSGLDVPYLTILALARSKREVKTFHDLLPANCRLLTNDLINLKNFWAKYFSPGINSKKGVRVGKLSNETLGWLLASQCPESSRVQLNYYLQRIREKGEIFTYEKPKYRILSCKNRSGSGDYHFNISISNADFGMGCLLSGDRKMLVVSILGDACLLDESLTHSITEWPGYELQERSKAYIKYGIIFRYFLDAKDFLPFLKEYKDSHRINLRDFIIKDGFLSLLLEKLKNNGLPVTSKNIESVTRHRDEMKEDNNLQEEDTYVRISPIKKGK